MFFLLNMFFIKKNIFFFHCITSDGVEVRRRWAEYFEKVLNVTDVREANINVVGNWQMRCWEI